MAEAQQPHYKLNSLVKIAQLNLQGYLKFQGKTHFKAGHWLGLELLPAHHGKGKNDGSIDGTRYFTCKPGNGIFIPLSKVSEVVQPTLRIPSTPRSSLGGSQSTQTTPRPRHSLSRLKSVDSMPPPSSPPTLTRTRLNSLSSNSTTTPHKRSSSVTSNRTPSRQSIDRPPSTVSQRTPSRQSLTHRKSYSRNLQPDDRATATANALSEELSSLKEKYAAQHSQLTELHSSQSDTSSQLQHTSSQLHDTATQLQEALQDISARESELQTCKQEHDQALSQLRDVHSQDIETHNATIAQLQSELDDLRMTLEHTQEELQKTSASKDEEIQTLKSALEDLDKKYAALATQKDDLEGLVTELRQAGQETIAMYEERFNATESRKFETDERIKTLETQYDALLAESRAPSSPNTTIRRQTTAAEIDNESLRQQLAHLQSKLSGCEEAYVELDRERETAIHESQKHTSKLQQDIKQLHSQLADVGKDLELSQSECTSSATRIQELEDALASTKELLESSRAHAETLQSDLENFENLKGGDAGKNDERIDELYKRLENEQQQHAEQVKELDRELQVLDERLKDSDSVIDVSKRECEFLRDELRRKAENESPSKTSNEVAALKNRVRELTSELDSARSDEQSRATDSLAPSNGVEAGQDVRTLQEQLKQSELRRKEIETKSHHDINELESLLEAKIFKEDDMERELVKLRAQLNIPHDSNLPKQSVPSSRSDVSDVSNKENAIDDYEDPLIAEFMRDAKQTTTSNSAKPPSTPKEAGSALAAASGLADVSSYGSVNGAQSKLFCDDCEEEGHTLDDCTANDIF